MKYAFSLCFIQLKYFLFYPLPCLVLEAESANYSVMGCSSSYTLSQNNSTNIKTYSSSNVYMIPVNLSTEDKNKIRYNWDTLSKDMIGNGGQILLRAFHLNSKVKDVFKCSGNSSASIVIRNINNI